jgi:hypothetical protein
MEKYCVEIGNYKEPKKKFIYEIDNGEAKFYPDENDSQISIPDKDFATRFLKLYNNNSKTQIGSFNYYALRKIEYIQSKHHDGIDNIEKEFQCLLDYVGNRIDTLLL